MKHFTMFLKDFYCKNMFHINCKKITVDNLTNETRIKMKNLFLLVFWFITLLK